MSEYTFTCPCGQKLSCDENQLGKEISCPICGTKLRLESDKTEYTQSVARSLQASAKSPTKPLWCQCYICEHKYDAKLQGFTLGTKIKCPNCKETIFCQEYEKTYDDYLRDVGFSTSYAYSTKLFIDDNSKQLVRFFVRSRYFFLIPYECVLGWDITQEQSETSTKISGDIEGKRKAAVVGTVLAGPVGTMVGMAGRKNVNLTSERNIKYKYHLNIILNDMKHSNISLTDLPLADVEAITARLNIIKHYNESCQGQNRKIKRIEMSQNKPKDYYLEDLRLQGISRATADSGGIAEWAICIITFLIPIFLGIILKSKWTYVWVAIPCICLAILSGEFSKRIK